MVSSEMLTLPGGTGPAAQIPAVLPLVPLESMVAFPNMMFPLVVSEPQLLKLADEALGGSKMIGLFAVRPDDGKSDGRRRTPHLPVSDGKKGPRVDGRERFAVTGTAAYIQKMLRFPDGGMRLLVQGLARVRLAEMVREDPFPMGRVDLVPVVTAEGKRVEALHRNAVELFQKLVDATGYLSDELKVVAVNIDDVGRLADFLGANLNIPLAEKQALLDEANPEKRLEQATASMVRELDILALGRQIQEQVQTEMSRNQREFFLRQQMKAIQRELGDEEGGAEIDELRGRIEAAGMPDEARDAALKELERLARMAPQAAEYTVSKTYIDWMLSVPWRPVERPAIDIARAEKVLDDDHHDLAEVKERILEYLAVRKLKARPKSPILCLAGPPGVGKTSLGRSIARALERPFARLALGGLHDEAEIRGHRRTYIGALPGRILQAVVSAKAPDPVFMLDEIDKVGADFRGDPTSALLEVLDPEQNNSFRDNYLNVAFDLSGVLFITTANALYSIPGPLRDRMEVIELPGYVTADKVEIARRFLIPKALDDNGIEAKHVRFTRAALVGIVNDYTREAGVRNLERQLNRVVRKVATQVARGKRPRVALGKRNLADYLGKPRIYREGRGTRPRVGVATGMAWTPFGGEILFIEASRMEGRGQMILTGQLGSVMQESAQAARTWIRSNLDRLGVKPDALDRLDIHIHVPAGALPKDGPSAGVAMVTALASLVTGRRVRHDTAMTGEISLRGMVLPIGGLKQKVLGAKRAGIRRILYPAQNAPDLEEIPADQRSRLTFVPVETIEEVLDAALVPERRAKRGRASKRRAATARRPRAKR